MALMSIWPLVTSGAPSLLFGICCLVQLAARPMDSVVPASSSVTVTVANTILGVDEVVGDEAGCLAHRLFQIGQLRFRVRDHGRRGGVLADDSMHEGILPRL